MNILLLNPSHPSIGSRIPHEHLPPLGLLAVGGPLIDAGHNVRLLDAEFGRMSIKKMDTVFSHGSQEAGNPG
jgi:anaerobic magnesium-protoporphyrin IX monomethyl ester cyclase